MRAGATIVEQPGDPPEAEALGTITTPIKTVIESCFQGVAAMDIQEGSGEEVGGRQASGEAGNESPGVVEPEAKRPKVEGS